MGAHASTPRGARAFVVGRDDDETEEEETGDERPSRHRPSRHRAGDEEDGGAGSEARARVREEEEEEEEEEEVRARVRGASASASASASATSHGELRRCLKTLCASRRETPARDDVFWYEIGNAVSEPLTGTSGVALDALTRPFAEAMYAKDGRRGGLYKLARHAARQLRVASGNARTTPVSAINVTVLTTMFVKHFMEFASENDGEGLGVGTLGGRRSERLRALDATFSRDARWETNGDAGGERTMTSPFDDLLRACMEIVSNKHVTSQTMALHAACVRFLLVATSSQLAFDLDDIEGRENGHPLARRLLAIATTDGALVGSFMCALARLFIQRPSNSGDIHEGSANASTEASTRTSGEGRGGAFFGFLFASSREKTSRGSRATTQRSVVKHSYAVTSPLASECVNLFLALCTHGAFGAASENPFRRAVSEMKDVSTRDSVPASKRKACLVNFTELFAAIRATLPSDAGLLLSYAMLSSSARFVSHVAKSDDLPQFVRHLLRDLYHAREHRGGHASQLIVASLLILSQNERFVRAVNVHPSGSTNWYKERIISECSLGSLIFIILSREVTYDASKTMHVSKTLHALGVIANMACVARDVSGYAAQRLVNVLALFTKRYAKAKRVRANSTDALGHKGGENELDVYEDLIRVVFEILNCLVTDLDSLGNNPEIVYALIHREDVLGAYRTHAMFAEYVQNIECVLEHYQNAIESVRVEQKDSPMSVDKLKRVISENRLTASPQKTTGVECERNCSMHGFHPMRFEYVEDDTNTPYFLIPYVWGVVHSMSGVRWNESAVALFAAPDEPDDDGGDDDEDASSSMHSSVSEHV